MNNNLNTMMMTDGMAISYRLNGYKDMTAILNANEIVESCSSIVKGNCHITIILFYERFYFFTF